MKEYRNILAYALVNLGDVVLVTGALALLKRAYPEAKITLMVKPTVQEAVLNNPVIDEVMIFGYKAKEKSWRQTIKMLKEIRRRHFDLAISFDRKLRPALLAWLAKIPTRVGPSKVFGQNDSRVTLLYTDVAQINYDLDKHLQRETYQDIVRHITGQTESAMPVMAQTEAINRKRAQKLKAKVGVASKYIMLCVKGTFVLKTWPKEYFAELAKRLSERYRAAFLIVGAPGDKDYADEVMTAIKNEVGEEVGIVNLCGQTALSDLTALAEITDLFVTVDTGAAHVAATVGRPMVVVYGCTHPDRWHPANDNAIVLTTDESCSPCSYRAEECLSAPRPNCLYNLTPDAVFTACQKLLG